MKKHSSKKFHYARSKRIGIILFIVCTLLLAGCGSSQSDESTLERAQRQGYVTIGFANEKPYAYQTAEGELTGEAVAVAQVILKNLGIEEMRGTLTEFASLIPGLQASRFDMITAGMFITPDRAEDVALCILGQKPQTRINTGIALILNTIKQFNNHT